MQVRIGIAILAVFLGLMAACAGPGSTQADNLPLSEEANTTPASESPPVPSAAPEVSAGPTSEATASSRSTPVPAPAVPASDEVSSARLVDLGSGSPAHQFELTLFNGETLRLSDLRGSVVVLNFWASWCPPCRWEMPAFERIWQEYRDQGVVFFGIAISDEEEKARSFAQKAGITYPLALDPTGNLAVTYRALSLPTTFLIDRQGNEARKFGIANDAALRIFLKGLLDDT